jgi:CBS domain-containing protein
MTTMVEIVGPDASIREAAQKMRGNDLGALPVGDNNRLIGIVTDRDITVRGVAEGRADGNATVRDVMSEQVFCCFADDDVDRAAEIMAEHQVRRLPVLDEDKRLVGVVTLADLCQLAGSAEPALMGITEPTGQSRR